MLRRLVLEVRLSCLIRLWCAFHESWIYVLYHGLSLEGSGKEHGGEREAYVHETVFELFFYLTFYQTVAYFGGLIFPAWKNAESYLF